jgi:hypothetical protein
MCFFSSVKCDFSSKKLSFLLGQNGKEKNREVGINPICFNLENEQRGVSHCGLAVYIKKYLKAKEELWKLKYFNMQKYNLQKIL